MEKVEKLDRTRPYGTIYGNPGWGFEQDGVHYSPDGKMIEKWSTPEAIQAEAALAAKRKALEARLALAREAKERKRREKEET